MLEREMRNGIFLLRPGETVASQKKIAAVSEIEKMHLTYRANKARI